MIEVTCAIIQDGLKVLAVKRAHGMHLAGKWEFPGGKIEAGETQEDCIVREIREELDIEVKALKKLKSIEHHYPEKNIRLIPFLCSITSGDIDLKEHEESRWVLKNEILVLDWAEADTKVIEANLIWKMR